jgi:hypothetical protein
MSEERLEFENERVRVSRIHVGAGSTHPPRSRNDRVIVWLTVHIMYGSAMTAGERSCTAARARSLGALLPITGSKTSVSRTSCSL